jgi:hypothetical protein
MVTSFDKSPTQILLVVLIALLSFMAGWPALVLCHWMKRRAQVAALVVGTTLSSALLIWMNFGSDSCCVNYLISLLTDSCF